MSVRPEPPSRNHARPFSGPESVLMIEMEIRTRPWPGKIERKRNGRRVEPDLALSGTSQDGAYHYMRIIAGQRRGHKIDGPRASAGTRPTSDLVRESLFNILGDLVVDRIVFEFSPAPVRWVWRPSAGVPSARLCRAGPRVREPDHSQCRHTPLRRTSHRPAGRCLSLGQGISAGRRASCCCLDRPSVSRIRAPGEGR